MRSLSVQQEEIVGASVLAACSPPHIVVRAGPGSGKTHTVVSVIHKNIEFGAIRPEEIIAITFTRRAAKELQERLGPAGEGVYASTIDALALHFVQRVHPTAEILTPSSASLLFSHVCTMHQIKFTEKVFKEYQEYLESSGDQNPEMERLHASYWSLMRMGHMYDYQSILLLATELINDGSIARSELKVELVIVDEAQDTSFRQWSLIEAIIARSGGRLVIVGDINQTIYSWRNAKPEIFAAYQRRCTSLPCTVSYRCSPPIVHYANTLIEMNEDAVADVTSARSGVFEPVQLSTGSILDAVLECVAQPFAYDDIAVLCRTNRTVSAVAKVLRDAGLPVNAVRSVESGESLVTIAAMLGRNQDNPLLVFLFARFFDKWTQKSLGATVCDGLSSAEWESLILDLAGHGKVGKSFIGFMTACADDFRTMAEALKELDDIEELSDELRVIRRKAGGMFMKNAIQRLTIFDEVEKPENEITVCTVHQAKGLEWPAVVITDLTAGKFPSGFASRGDNGLDEERRVMYVAVTRAKDFLVLHGDPNKPSQFILSEEIRNAGKVLGEAEKAIRAAGF